MAQNRIPIDRISRRSRPTQQTIADITGLAVTTVSKALRQDPKISHSTRALVNKIAQEVGYVPDRAALRLRTGKTNVISLILDPHNEILSFGNSMISGVVKALQETNYHLNIIPHFTQDEIESPVVQIVRNGLADGLIFSRTTALDERVRFLTEKHFPFVTHGRTEFTEQHSFVDYDNDDFAYQSVMRLVQKGCAKVCILLPLSKFTFYQHLRYGFMRAVRETGVDYLFPQTVSLDSQPDELVEWARTLAQSGEIPDGMICPGEISYFAVQNGFTSAGKKQGSDYHMVAKSVSKVLGLSDPGLDCIDEDVHQAGFLMASHLVDQINNPEAGPLQTLQQPIIKFK
ncbi:LacI family DNA-binding transcriptional regulator [Cohaesibacter celericrescens]|uniref:LacI family transcriptional regulator n=1 Tax=Cohaesibacter celericrescens TaxID=2067669 RepID=A0A2N5XU26_9HYPH|nr:LacI family DNA-binding transcriptional regulator [Cohaesibacter celericrescens]PLW77918.1 LacI family transcriptional regulator [Cohaesibacter celericrescens]